MKKVFALVLVSLFALVIGCGGSQPAADTMTVDESAMVVTDANAGDAAQGAQDMAEGAEDMAESASLDATAEDAAVSEGELQDDATAEAEGDAASADDAAAMEE